MKQKKSNKSINLITLFVILFHLSEHNFDILSCVLLKWIN